MGSSPTRRVTVFVIGGGPAGAACAIRLRQHGLRVELAEQHRFPRAKACGCCLGGAGLAALDVLGRRRWVEAHGQPLSLWEGSFDGKKFSLPLKSGVAISRESLDSELLNEARCSGVEVHQPSHARILATESDGVRIGIRQGDNEEVDRRADVVVVASGLNGSGINRAKNQGWLEWEQRPQGPFGISFTLPPQPALESSGTVERDRLLMACDDDGYVGMVHLEDGRIDIAAALQRDRPCCEAGSPIQRVWGLLDRSGLPCPASTEVKETLTTGPLRRTRQAGQGRLLVIGDAAGYVEPFTGEGMTWAMETGMAAASHIAGLGTNLENAGDLWAKEIRRWTESRRRRCRLVTSALRSAKLRRIAAGTLATFPQLARPLLSQLDRRHGSESIATLSPVER